MGIKNFIIRLMGAVPAEEHEQERQMMLAFIPDISREHDLTLNDYQGYAAKTLQPRCRNKEYLCLGLADETGEVCGKIKRLIRGDGAVDDSLLYEIGDVLWYISQLAMHFHVPLDRIAKMNIEKLTDRQERGVIAGTGDHR